MRTCPVGSALSLQPDIYRLFCRMSFLLTSTPAPLVMPGGHLLLSRPRPASHHTANEGLLSSTGLQKQMSKDNTIWHCVGKAHDVPPWTTLLVNGYYKWMTTTQVRLDRRSFIVILKS